VTNHHFSHMHTSFWLGIEQCSNWRWNLVPDESVPRLAWHTYQKLLPKNEVDLWSRFLEHVTVSCLRNLAFSHKKKTSQITA